MTVRPKYLLARSSVAMPSHVCREVADAMVNLRRLRYQNGAPLSDDACEWVDAVVAAARLYEQERSVSVSVDGSNGGSADGGSAEIPGECTYDLTVADVAAYIDRSERRVRQLADSGELPARKFGGPRSPWYFDSVEVFRWLEERDRGY